MNWLYTKFVSYKESIPTCCLTGKDQISQMFKLSGFHQILKQKNSPMAEGCAGKLPFYDSLVFKSRNVLEGEEKLENKSKYSNYHIIHGFNLKLCMFPLIFSLYDADLKNYFFLKKEHVLAQWRRGKEYILDWLITQLTERKQNARLSWSYAHLLNPQSLNIQDLTHGHLQSFANHFISLKKPLRTKS